jgi:hypothetical protein
MDNLKITKYYGKYFIGQKVTYEIFDEKRYNLNKCFSKIDKLNYGLVPEYHNLKEKHNFLLLMRRYKIRGPF